MTTYPTTLYCTVCEDIVSVAPAFPSERSAGVGVLHCDCTIVDVTGADRPNALEACPEHWAEESVSTVKERVTDDG